MSDRPDNHAFKNTILKYGSNMTNPLLLGRSAFIIGAILFGVVACKREEKFPDLGDRFAAPIDVAADETGNYFYVLSSDDSRDYNTGSIVTLSRDGDKLAVTPTPRLGRSLSVAGNDLLVTYSNTGEGAGSRLDLYDITDPKKLKMSVSWPLNDCNPINAVMRSGYNYFAVSCSNGQIYIGELSQLRSASQLHLVRRYPGARRALHLDPSRNLLLAFPTDLRTQISADVQLTDLKTFTDDDSDASSAVPNEIPDVWEENKVGRRNKARWGTYQYIVYDIAEEAKKNFPSVEDSSLVPAELRWVYFSLSNFDGSPDISRTTKNINERYYRTNFWEAKPDLNDVDSFFISHRGTSDANRIGSPHANSIIRVRMTGDLRPSGGAAPKTEDVLSFERVYGFRGELEESGKHFPCDFEIASVKGSSLLLVNHFRDVKNFPASRYASVVSKVLGENGWFSEISEGATGHSYYQLALTPSGRAMAVSFFQNIAILLDAAPGTAITEFKTIN